MTYRIPSTNSTTRRTLAWADGCLHHLIKQPGYQAINGEEEIDIVFEDLRNRLYALAGGINTPRAEQKIEELVYELNSLPSNIR